MREKVEVALRALGRNDGKRVTIPTLSGSAPMFGAKIWGFPMKTWGSIPKPASHFTAHGLNSALLGACLAQGSFHQQLSGVLGLSRAPSLEILCASLVCFVQRTCKGRKCPTLLRRRPALP